MPVTMLFKKTSIVDFGCGPDRKRERESICRTRRWWKRGTQQHQRVGQGKKKNETYHRGDSLNSKLKWGGAIHSAHQPFATLIMHDAQVLVHTLIGNNVHVTLINTRDKEYVLHIASYWSCARVYLRNFDNKEPICVCIDLKLSFHRQCVRVLRILCFNTHT